MLLASCVLDVGCWMLESWRQWRRQCRRPTPLVPTPQRIGRGGALCVGKEVLVSHQSCESFGREKEPRFTFLASLCYLSTYYRILFLSRDHNKDRVGRHCRHYSLVWYVPLHGRVVQVPAIAAMS